MKMTRALMTLIAATTLISGATGVVTCSQAEARNKVQRNQVTDGGSNESSEVGYGAGDEETPAQAEDSTDPAGTEAKSESPEGTSLLGLVFGGGAVVIGIFGLVAFLCVSHLALPALVYFMGNVFRGKKPTVG